MKILWVVNIKIPLVFDAQGKKNRTNTGGWLDRISRGIIENGHELIVCYPNLKDENGTSGKLSYCGFQCDSRNMHKGQLDDKAGIENAKKIIENYAPDVLHIHGTEYQYSWYFVMAAKYLNIDKRLIVSIQGLVGVCAKHFSVGIPERVCKSRTLKEMINRKNIADDKKYYEIRGDYEKKTICMAHNVMGRTIWDYACTTQLNPKIHYYTGYETLREAFYSGKWEYSKCVRHRIFMSQASYPIKGFHLFIEALAIIKNDFPDVTVHVAGNPPTNSNWISGNTYNRYIEELMEKYDVKESIKFCGSLDSFHMREEMLESNVFVSASLIENSPNSVAEAMLLGLPVVSSNVGGVQDMIVTNKEGYLYQVDAPYMLAYYVKKVFKDEDNSVISDNERKKAIQVHDYEKNLQSLLLVYNELMNKRVDLQEEVKV